MTSLTRPLRDIRDVASCDIPYWLPPGGRDNGVWADTWELLTDIEFADVITVLDLLAAADIGGYAAIPGGRRARARGPVPYTLWIDAAQYGAAEEVLIRFMQNRVARLAF